MAYVGLAPSGAELYDHDVSNLLLNIGNGMNPHCFDRRGPEFCESLLQRKGRWHNRQLTCSNSPAIAFRVCRKSCGFCSDHQTTSSVRWLSEESLDRKKCTSIIS
uniref:ShKT domain-containing protein n=1 Tax=Rhabditophanes sp. KR3021 TaxID=114890 RepID=A0AC35U161_9BILA